MIIWPFEPSLLLEGTFSKTHKSTHVHILLKEPSSPSSKYKGSTFVLNIKYNASGASLKSDAQLIRDAQCLIEF